MLSTRDGQTQGQQESLQQQVGDCNTWQHQEAGGDIFPLGSALDLFPWSMTLVVTEHGGGFVPWAGHSPSRLTILFSGTQGCNQSQLVHCQSFIPISLGKDLWGMVLFQGLNHPGVFSKSGFLIKPLLILTPSKWKDTSALSTHVSSTPDNKEDRF